MLRRFIEAVESGELMAKTPQDVAVVRRLQGALTALEAVAVVGSGEGPSKTRRPGGGSTCDEPRYGVRRVLIQVVPRPVIPPSRPRVRRGQQHS